MLRSLIAVLHVLLVVAIPILANCNYLRSDLFPRIAHKLSLHQITADTTVLAVALTTLYAYFLLGLVYDLAQANHKQAVALLEKYPDSVVAQRKAGKALSIFLFIEHAQQEVRHLFPGMIILPFYLSRLF